MDSGNQNTNVSFEYYLKKIQQGGDCIIFGCVLSNYYILTC